MKKLFLLTSLFMTSYFNSQIAFNHSAGATYMIVVQQGYIGGYPGVTYNPRLDYVLKESLSISLTSYPTIAANTEYGYLAINVPILAQVNLGNHASEDAENAIGLFAGGGYSFGAYSDAGKISGPCVTAGLKFGEERPLGLRFEMVNGKMGFDDKRERVYSLGILYNF